MFHRFQLQRPIRLLVAVVGALVAPLASAQVQIKLTTTQSQDCTALTDSQGLRLAPDGVNLLATGVALSGNGCGGNNAADYQVATSVPANVTAGTAFNVSWSAAAAATACYYSGSSAAGWPVGSSACTGAACAGSHNTSVTVAAAGSYTFGVICTNATGAASGTTTATGAPQPPQPNGFALTAPATATVGTPFSVSWSVSGATSCTGTASLSGSSANLPGWTDTTSPGSPRSVTATLAGTYTLQLICSNAVPGNATSQQAIVVVGGGVDPDNCPATPMSRMTVATIQYPNIPPGSTTRTNVDLRAYENIWGHSDKLDAAVLWPGRAGSQPAIMNWPKTQYIAAKFHVPAGQSTTSNGWLGYGSYFSGPAITLAISTQCGDFAPVNPLCVTTRNGGESFGKWRIVPNLNGCPLTPGQDYFMNMRMENPQTSDCGGGGACTLATNNTFTN